MMGSCKRSDAERFRPIMDSDFSNQEGSTDLPFKLDFFLIHLYLAHIHFRLKILHLRVKISIKVHSWRKQFNIRNDTTLNLYATCSLVSSGAGVLQYAYLYLQIQYKARVRVK